MTTDTPGCDPAPVDDDGDADDGPSSADESAVRCRIVTYDDGDECTLYPVDADEDDLVTRWVSAKGDAFVDLSDYR